MANITASAADTMMRASEHAAYHGSAHAERLIGVGTLTGPGRQWMASVTTPKTAPARTIRTRRSLQSRREWSPCSVVSGRGSSLPGVSVTIDSTLTALASLPPTVEGLRQPIDVLT